jgi:hypothetical protein
VCGHMFASIVVLGFYKLGTRKSVYAVGVCVGYMVLLLHQYFLNYSAWSRPLIRYIKTWRSGLVTWKQAQDWPPLPPIARRR